MSLYKRKNTWWVRFTAPGGERVRRSTGTSNRTEAQEFYDRLRAQYWRVRRLGEKPDRTWQEAVVRWLEDSREKATLEDDKVHLRWVDGHLRECLLHEIGRDTVDRLVQGRLATGVSNATVNRMLAVVRSILRKAQREWEWLERVPRITLLAEPKRRIRFLTRVEADRLLAELPPHLSAMARFTLATGLRKANVCGLEWRHLDLEQRVLVVPADRFKSGRPLGVPLNADAVDVLRGQHNGHPSHVFTYRGAPIQQVSTKAWKKALARARIADFRWHDLRHTWASWHIQQGTPLAVLQELGGWETVEMVRKYAHLAPTHLAEYAEQLARSRPAGGTNQAQGEEEVMRETA